VSRDGRRFKILEAADAPAAAWPKRWDSLKLFTPVRYDSLPGLPFPGDPDSYPGRDEVVEYLARYAEHFNLPVRFNSEVLAVRAGDDAGFVVQLRDRAYAADQVVVATGPLQTPRVPAIAEQLDATLVQMHSTDYRGPADVPGGPVLVVGGGNTGYQIAEELAAANKVHLAVGSR
jgi:putative flavoprotein involved in K+ transport